MNQTISMFEGNRAIDWGTPDGFLDFLATRMNLRFDLDAAASNENHKAPCYFTEEDDGLNQEWYGRVWLNPPYGRKIPLWLKKCSQEIKREGVESIHVLIPARTDTKWFHDIVVRYASTVFLIKGRLNFKHPSNIPGANAPFPSMLVVFDKWPRVMQRAYIKPLTVPTWARGFGED